MIKYKIMIVYIYNIIMIACINQQTKINQYIVETSTDRMKKGNNCLKINNFFKKGSIHKIHYAFKINKIKAIANHI